MTLTKEDNNYSSDIVVTAEPETDAAVVTATAVAFEGGDSGVGQGNEPPIPPGHARFYCSKCRAVSERMIVHILMFGGDWVMPGAG